MDRIIFKVRSERGQLARTVQGEARTETNLCIHSTFGKSKGIAPVLALLERAAGKLPALRPIKYFCPFTYNK